MEKAKEAGRLVAPGEAETIEFAWGRLHWLMTGRRLPDVQQTFGLAEIGPGQKNPRHYHPNCDELLYLLEGELEHTLGESLYHLTSGALLHIPQGVTHDAHNPGRGTARMVIVYSSPDRQTVFLEPGGDY